MSAGIFNELQFVVAIASLPITAAALGLTVATYSRATTALFALVFVASAGHGTPKISAA
jgi:hypothetical protein